MKKKSIFLIIVLTILTLLPAFSQNSFAQKNFKPLYSDPTFTPAMPSLSESEQKRQSWLNARKNGLEPFSVIDKLNLKPGMTILDLGAGTGYFTIPFGYTLNNTGKVFATDINPKRLKIINQEAAKRKITNIKTVPVQPFGLDPFYQKQKYDLIFLSEVYFQIEFMQNTIEYFKGLLPTLKENGRLCIIQPKDTQNITAQIDPNDNGLFIIMFKRLQKKENAPIVNRLSEGTKDYVLNWIDDGKTAIPIKKREAVLNDLNNILQDKRLILDVLDSYAPKDMLNKWDRIENIFPKSSEFMNWLAVRLLDNNCLIDDSELSELNKKRVSKLNNLILRETLKIPETLLFSVPNPLSNLLVSKESVIDMMRRCGFAFDKGYELKYHHLLLFKAAPKN